MTHLYFCACDKKGGIYHYRLENNRPVFCEKLPLDRPMYMVTSGRKAYILLRETDTVRRFGGLITCDIADNGKLENPTAPVSTNGIVPCHLSVLGNAVYAVNYLSGNVVKIPGKTVTHSGSGPHPTRQEAAHTHFVAPDPGGKYLFCTDLGLDTIFVYDPDLNRVSQAQTPAGCGARHLTWAPNGKTVYCVGELSSTVSVFDYKNGQLQLLNTYKCLPGNTKENTAAAIRLQGEYLYVSNRGADTITRFRREENGLTLMENTPCGGRSPRDFMIVGGQIFCTNEQSNSVTVLRLENGKPSLTDTILHMENPLCVCTAEL